ncbi:hypothetical protein [uncultured Paracoccus sp.]|uniref:hypothetical protein n=1 Tax=uncultured Paracoccus sp. TaxID=189685 RepID=UPI00259489CD|nr:hypothetical protein [uncultured Paracoccus sp.]
MTSIITAAEARALDPALAAPAVLDRLDKMIREAAFKGAKKLRVPHDLTISSGYCIQFRTPGVSEALKEAGYAVTPRCEERQFVDVWLEISWRDA